MSIKSHQHLRFTRYRLRGRPSRWIQATHCVNHRRWRGWDQGTVLLEGVYGRKVLWGLLWRLAYVFACRPHGWEVILVIPGKPAGRSVQVFADADFRGLLRWF